ncbi:cystathionine beta-lyase [Labrys wisconsinensis]|uniref:Cystathionine beta-lyase n=1 Tax=Labrys wisconsinensis TaxID=425677 RepID=A0ABU0J466_9HYPH|nr:cystathionine beta-lyase [Labrys wisconsinensis]MDQ0468331.1 cystathionine beta-lyase [Labrys wisconsinensis]
MKKITKTDLAAFGENTRLVVGGRDPAAQHGFVNPPVYHGSTVLAPTVKDLIGRTQKYVYGRRGTPTSEALEEALAAVEGAAGVVLCPSGLSAVTTALLSCLSAGDHLLMTDSAYGPTRHACDAVLGRFGIETTYYDPRIGGDIAGLMRPNTRAVYLESPGSLTFEVQDVPAIAAAAHARGATVLLDNTWATPLFFKAHAHGVDLAIQAGTKYIVGHSDAMFGTISAAASAWPRLKAFHGDTGLCAGPDDIYLAMRGLRSMGVRLRQHQESGLAVARWLAARSEVQRVLHPALPGDPGHALWQRDFTGASGLFALVLTPAPEAAVEAFLDGLKLFGLGYSWGGFESLAIPFDASPYRTASAWNPGGPCVRLHIGLEDVADLIRDLEEGLERFRRAS